MNKNWTGERLETFVLNENTIEHLHRYAIASNYVKNKVVLDIASGEGYGSNLLSQYAEKVYGVDIDENTIELAKLKYVSKKIEFKVGRADLIPIKDNTIDVVVSFETLEHHDKHDEMMIEIKRVLKPDGILIISTPDKKFYSDEKNYKNPHHRKELYLDEFKILIKKHFNYTEFYFQNMFKGSLVISENKDGNFKIYEGNYTSINRNLDFNPMYILAVAGIKKIEFNIVESGFRSKLIDQIELERNLVEARIGGINWIKNQWSYKIGNALLKPLKFFKK